MYVNVMYDLLLITFQLKRHVTYNMDLVQDLESKLLL